MRVNVKAYPWPENFIMTINPMLSSSLVNIKELCNLLNGLRPRYRKLIKMRFVEQLTYSEISNRINLSIRRIWDLVEKVCDYIRRPNNFARILNSPNTQTISIQDNIFMLDFNNRVINLLLGHGIKTIGDLVEKTPSELMQIPRFGKTTLANINEALNKHGFKLKED